MVAVITAADPAAARTVLEIDKAGTDNSTAVTLANVADNYLSLNGQEITSGIVPVTLGGTGSSTAPMVGVITATLGLNFWFINCFILFSICLTYKIFTNTTV